MSVSVGVRIAYVVDAYGLGLRQSLSTATVPACLCSQGWTIELVHVKMGLTYTELTKCMLVHTIRVYDDYPYSILVL